MRNCCRKFGLAEVFARFHQLVTGGNDCCSCFAANDYIGKTLRRQ